METKHVHPRNNLIAKEMNVVIVVGFLILWSSSAITSFPSSIYLKHELGIFQTDSFIYHEI